MKSLSFLFSMALLFASIPSRAVVIEKDPPLLVRCYVQAFIMPLGNPDPRNQTIIATEMLEKGFRTDRILPHDRIKQGSYYVFGTISDTILRSQFNPDRIKQAMAKKAEVIFYATRFFQVVDQSIHLQGCESQQLF